ncbi:CBS domain containing protein [Burkholderia sp. H160]|nr:CBS domain containing protein [Burkholderia sp. H160]
MTKVAEVMTHDAVSIGATDTIRQAAMMMADHEVGSLPVCDGEELVGTVTDRDIAVRAVASGVDPAAPVIEIATQHVQWCYEDDDINDVKRKMAGRRIRRVPVLDHEKHLVGIVSLGDIATSDGAGAASTLKAVSRPTKPGR